MIVKNPKFEISAVNPKQYPKNDLPQIVLVGKSNVGKSSFINTMINRKSLARTSSEPGKTRQINFYNIDEKSYFIDLHLYRISKMSIPSILSTCLSFNFLIFTSRYIKQIIATYIAITICDSINPTAPKHSGKLFVKLFSSALNILYIP